MMGPGLRSACGDFFFLSPEAIILGSGPPSTSACLDADGAGGRIMALKDVHVLILRAEDYVRFRGQWELSWLQMERRSLIR